MLWIEGGLQSAIPAAALYVAHHTGRVPYFYEQERNRQKKEFIMQHEICLQTIMDVY